jgi:non-ribosomal peptide synthetase component F
MIKKHKINYLQSTPSILKNLLQYHVIGNITVLCGGEKLSHQLAQQLLSSNIHLWNFYGPTETTIWSTAYQVSVRSLKRSDIPIGKPISNTSVYILDHQQRLVPEGVMGELYIGGDGLAKGYINDTKQTKTNFVRVNCIPEQPKLRLYKTGDFVYWDKRGELIFTGRQDDQIKINGVRIEIHEIESVLNEHPFVEASVVLCVRLENNEKRLVAILILHDNNILNFLLNSKFDAQALSG